MKIYQYLAETGDRRTMLHKAVARHYEFLCSKDGEHYMETPAAREFADREFNEEDLKDELMNPMTGHLQSSYQLHITEESGKTTILPDPDILTFPKLEAFLIRPAINIAGLCSEADVSQIYLNRCRARGVLPGNKFMDKLLPVMKKYGF